MSQILTTPVVPAQRRALHAMPTPAQFIHPPCPAWCDRHWDSDEALRAGLPENQFRHHHGADVWVTLSTPPEEGRRNPVPPMHVVLTLDRYDDNGRVGEVAVSTAFKDGDGPPLEMLPNPLDVASVRLLAQTLLDTLAPLGGAEGAPRRSSRSACTCGPASVTRARYPGGSR